MSGGLIQQSRGEAKRFLFVLVAVAALGGLTGSTYFVDGGIVRHAEAL
jgi:hypothetical protein